ncbi:hydrogenase maturation protease [Desulfurococcus mucosus]|uniref:Hydrogenase maturation protease n=1 Tax=Desulfurococcus mucosus (strain ATCC 35584 / DSM 2162 / JCM 9187 / O7/1) TaxID=765177 RepID=E8R826_DESM0|nr:hydrogenase maturation protease [Desulfurococcus mucosus]ADV64652.1 hydrogenase maturation protease [Desulfurococcus mucosus DSM 2162]
MPPGSDTRVFSKRELIEVLANLIGEDTVIAGVGSPLRMDDRAGLVFCDKLLAKGFKCIKCEYGLENCINEIRESGAVRLVVVDAVLYEGAEPGEIVVASGDALAEKYSLATTHTLPVKTVLRILGETGVREVYVVGIAPKQLGYGLEVSDKVAESVEKLVEAFTSVLAGKQGRSSGERGDDA